ncbi:MAG: glycosyltransferase family 9 protein [Desulfovibrio sp.]|jgi:heptosyltransferase-2|nr:glycosyltransferase family 9 protein [Desulfovibrio sp.]
MRIGVWNTAFLGDAALTLPLLQSLRLRYPNARIDYYVRSGLERLFVPHPAINSVYDYAKNTGMGGMMKIAGEIRSRRYDLWISAHSSMRSGFIALLGKGLTRIGYDRPFFNRLLYSQVVRRRFGEMDETDCLLELLRPLGEGPLSHWPEIHTDLGAREKALAFFADIDAPVLGLHPGSVWATKRWPAEFFAEIGRRALKEGAYVLIFAGKGEEDLAGRVQQAILRNSGEISWHLKKRLKNFAGLLSLPELAAFFARLTCCLTNDAGPMHLAWAQNVPLTAVFGPTVRAFGFFPRGMASTVIELPLDCRPCGLHGHSTCPLRHHDCMTKISPDMVWLDVKVKLLH